MACASMDCTCLKTLRTAKLDNGEELSWVEWTEDPRHELVFENAYTRIYRTHFDPQQACETLWHKHSEVRLGLGLYVAFSGFPLCACPPCVAANG